METPTHNVIQIKLSNGYAYFTVPAQLTESDIKRIKKLFIKVLSVSDEPKEDNAT